MVIEQEPAESTLLWRRAAARHADAALRATDNEMRMHHLLSAADCLERVERLSAVRRAVLQAGSDEGLETAPRRLL
jgi:hypothetical protein